MKHKTLITMLARLLGVFLMVEGAARMVYAVMWIEPLLRGSSAGAWAYSVASLLSGSVYLLAGLYLLRGGKWVVDKIVPGDRPYCPECGYNLTGLTTQRCPECGTRLPNDVLAELGATAPEGPPA